MQGPTVSGQQPWDSTSHLTDLKARDLSPPLHCIPPCRLRAQEGDPMMGLNMGFRNSYGQTGLLEGEKHHLLQR